MTACGSYSLTAVDGEPGYWIRNDADLRLIEAMLQIANFEVEARGRPAVHASSANNSCASLKSGVSSPSVKEL
jgi:hypothetical protein